MTRPGRLVHCIPGMGGGGAERQLAYLAGPLRDLGWEVHVALVSRGPNFERLARSRATLHHLDARTNYDPRIAWQLIRIVRDVRPDLVQVWLFQMEIAGALAALSRGVPWILTERSSAPAYPRGWKQRLRSLVARRAVAIVANSAEGERYWIGRATSARHFIVPNAIPHEEILSSSRGDLRELGLEPSSRLILSLGRFSPEKNTRTLVEALRTLMADDGVVAILGGEGPLRASVESACATGRLAGRVVLPGYLMAPWRWMQRADVFVSVAYFEGHPNAVLEAAACGTPLVLSDIAAHRAILDDRCALFVPPDDVAAIAAAVRATLADCAAARERAAFAEARVAHLSIEAVARQYDVIYRDVLDGQVARRAPRAHQAGRQTSSGRGGTTSRIAGRLLVYRPDGVA